MADEKKYKRPKAEKPAPEKDWSYFNERMLKLGWTPELNTFRSSQWSSVKGVMVPAKPGTAEHLKWKHELFDADAEGNIVINYYQIHGAPASYLKKGNVHPTNYAQKRLRTPWTDEKGKSHKYDIPKGAGVPPWFPPNVISAFEEAREIDTLFLTEGALKAWMGSVAGLYVVGLVSISTQKDKTTGAMHEDVLRLIRRCKPKNVVWLMDGDCRDLPKGWISQEDKEVDLATRHNSMFAACHRTRELLKTVKEEVQFELYFMQVNSESLTLPDRTVGPKGMDDLFVAYGDLKAEEARPMASLHIPGSGQWTEEQRAEETAKYAEAARRDAWLDVAKDAVTMSANQRFFMRVPMERMGKVKDHFHIENATDFYNFYLKERWPKEAFVWNGTKYKWDEAKKELLVEVPAHAKKYARIGTKYYRMVTVPNQFGHLRDRLDDWDRVSIKEDHGDNFLVHIPKYLSFCNVPDHVNFQQIIHGCWNLYSPLPIAPAEEEGDWSTTEKFLKHIFGEQEVTFVHPTSTNADGSPKTMSFSTFEMGLDYLQILYTNPTQKLPILCLTSEDRGTGKTTFGNWLCDWMGNNAMMAGNDDLVSDFNAHYIGKCAMVVEESKIEKDIVVEKLKNLATADQSTINAKGVQQKPIDVCLHIIMLTNNIRNFIRTDDKETRFWVLQVPAIPDTLLDTEIRRSMYEEIPAFLRMLSNRKYATEKLYRAWFHPKLLETKALEVVRQHSESNAKKQIKNYFKQLFPAIGVEEMYYTAEDIVAEVFAGSTRVDVSYVKELMKELGIDKLRNEKGDSITARYRIPRVEVNKHEGTVDVKFISVNVARRPYVIPRTLFWKDEVRWQLTREEHPLAKGGLLGAKSPAVQAVGAEAGQDDKGDLPF